MKKMQLKNNTASKYLSSIYPESVDRSQRQTVANNLSIVPFFYFLEANKVKWSFDEDDREELKFGAETTNDNFNTEVYVLMDKVS